MSHFQEDDCGQCPFCSVTVKYDYARNDTSPVRVLPYQENGRTYAVTLALCPACHRVLITRAQVEWPDVGNRRAMEYTEEQLLWPRAGTRVVPDEVPAPIGDDFREACLTVTDSPKASAALSRRCLQAILRDHGYAQHELAAQIDAAMKSAPAYLADQLNMIRAIGNFAAHPMKDTATDQIVDVEPGEAEYNIEVLELAFDFYYVQPARAKSVKAAVNAKLQGTGKPPI